MTQIPELLANALVSILTLDSLLWIVAGTFLGIVVGAIPGFTSSMATGILLPVTFALNPIQAMIFLVSVYIATIYGGSITAILLNTPGAPESSASTFDGYKMTLKGMGCEALGVSFMSSAFGGLISYITMIFAMVPIAWFAIKIGSSELFLLAIMGVSVLATLSTENAAKTLLAGFIGLLIGTIGITPTGEWRATFGSMYIAEGVQVVPAIIGFFAFSEVLTMVDKKFIVNSDVKTKPDVRKIIKGMGMALKYPVCLIKSAVMGMVIGAIPAAGGTVAAFTSYGEAKRASKNGDKFGTGEPEGLVAPESANNACTGGALMTTLALGVPGSSTCAILLSALMIQGLRPGPQLVREQMPLVYIIITAAIISQVIMLFMSVMAGYGLTNLLNIPTKVLAPVLAIFCVAGSFAVRNALFDVWIMFGFGLFGLMMKRHDFSLPAIVLGIVLGSIADNELIRTYMLFGKSFYTAFVTRPISLVLLVIVIFSVAYPAYGSYKKKKCAKQDNN